MSCINSNDGTESSESRAQENNENPVIKNDEVKKVNSDGTTRRQLELHTLQRHVEFILTELSSTLSLRWSQVKMRPLKLRRKRRLSNDVAVHPKVLLLLLQRLKKREQWHQRVAELAEEGRGQLTPTHQQSR